MVGINPWIGVLIYASLATVTFGSIIPFTLQYAREMGDPELWVNPVFIQVNNRMTGVWGGIFVINLVLDYLTLVTPERFGRIAPPLTYVVIGAVIIFTILYPGYVRRTYPRALLRNSG